MSSRSSRLRRILPTLALTCLTAPALVQALPAHAAPANTPAAPTAGVLRADASFPTWGTRWVVHATPDIDSPSVGMINRNSAGEDRITADYQVDTGRRVCEGSYCSTFMAHITAPVTGFLTVVAVDIPEDRLPGVPVKDAPPPAAPRPAHDSGRWSAPRPGSPPTTAAPCPTASPRTGGTATARTAPATPPWRSACPRPAPTPSA
ncbi:hypothetical protein [Streptomyces sp. CC219B]|uniref:hypothetical protein n=1 Tax=Streptomyces sp. CC219B TaxID=3044574 RepID=UPI0024A9ABD8|nr:hypothetical protein [Streptomyces sp. CC219B]